MGRSPHVRIGLQRPLTAAHPFPRSQPDCKRLLPTGKLGFNARRIFVALCAPHTVLDGFTDLVAEGAWRLSLARRKED